MSIDTVVAVLSDFRSDFFSAAFSEGKRIGVMEDGHYDRTADIEFLCMYSALGV